MLSINPAGAVIGYYYDAGGQMHGFRPTGDGAFTKFDPPASFYTGTEVINRAGTITGSYLDTSVLSLK